MHFSAAQGPRPESEKNVEERHVLFEVLRLLLDYFQDSEWRELTCKSEASFLRCVFKGLRWFAQVRGLDSLAGRGRFGENAMVPQMDD
jgi:hypothetical protein